jgi:glycosyltransferase involved in cell wall biosynthesis
MQTKNVLLLTYYWPPSGGAGVHRWLRFSKYFKENNCELTVYCPENAAWPAIDLELQNQVSPDIKVIRRKIFEPHKYLQGKVSTGVGFTQTKKQSLFSRLIVWVRGNLFIPDSRVFWIKPSTRFLLKYLKEHPEINTIISTGPPHSMHLIARNLKRKTGIKWIADYRDPWTQIDFYQDLLPGERADKKHKRLEKECLVEPDEIVTVSNACAEGLAEIADRKIHVVTNGYEFTEFKSEEIKLDDSFSISHLGSMPFARNPKVLWAALSNLVKNPLFAERLTINLIGTVDYQVLNSAKEYGLEKYIHLTPPISHQESIELQRSTQLLLLVANSSGNVKGILTGKFFEYLGARRPIIAIGEQNSDLNKAVIDTTSGYFSHFEDNKGLEEYLANAFNQYCDNSLSATTTNIDQYNSAVLAKKFMDLL